MQIVHRRTAQEWNQGIEPGPFAVGQLYFTALQYVDQILKPCAEVSTSSLHH